MAYKEKEIEKLYYSIGEVAEMFSVAPSLIRFWESEFDLIQPKKNRKGNRPDQKHRIDTCISAQYRATRQHQRRQTSADQRCRMRHGRRHAGRDESRNDGCYRCGHDLSADGVLGGERCEILQEFVSVSGRSFWRRFPITPLVRTCCRQSSYSWKWP